MPQYFMDENYFEEYAVPFDAQKYQSNGKGRFSEYVSGRCEFKVELLSPTAMLVYHALLERNVSRVWCRYDGGHDEGFAHFEDATAEGTKLGLDQLAAEFALGPLGDINETSRFSHLPTQKEQLPRDYWVRYAIQEFVMCLTNQFLGEGFGVGEVELHGRFSLDLASNEIVDDESYGQAIGAISPEERAFYEFGIASDGEDDVPVSNMDMIGESIASNFDIEIDDEAAQQWQLYLESEALTQSMGMTPPVLLTRDVLLEHGVSEIICRYDESSDEPWGYFGTAIVGTESLTLAQLMGDLASGPLGEGPGEQSYSARQLTRSGWVRYALEKLVNAYAIQILNDEWYLDSLPQYFRVDLSSGAWKESPPSEGFDTDAFYELGMENGNGDYEEVALARQVATAHFEPEKLPAFAAHTYRIFVEQGVTQVQGRYSFGEDEEFANIKSVTLLSSEVDVYALAERLADHILGAPSQAEMGLETSRARFGRVHRHLDKFAGALVTQLFKDSERYGQGYFYADFEANDLREEFLPEGPEANNF